MQRIHVVGRVGQDPEMRHTGKGDAVVNFSLADTERWKDKDGNQQNKTEWFRCKCFGKQAEIINMYVKKGEQLAVSGKMRTSEWEKDGERRKTVELVIDGFELISSRDGGQPSQPPSKPQSASTPEFDEDVPF